MAYSDINTVIVITTYIPDNTIFMEDFKTRR